MTLRIKDTGLTAEDELRLSRAVSAAEGNPSGPWLTPEQYISGGADLMRNQAMFAAQNSRKAIRLAAEEREQMVVALAERDVAIGKASELIDALEDENKKLKAENEKLRRKK